MFRIDTLEIPNLKPGTIGFSTLKLAVDQYGCQPGHATTQRHYPNIRLNAGRFELPIIYGWQRPHGEFNEAFMSTLPHIHGAFLDVTLFDPSSEKVMIDAEDDYALQVRPFTSPSHVLKENVVLSSTCVLCKILSYLDVVQSLAPLPPLPIDEALLDDIKAGAAIGPEEKTMAIHECKNWLISVFPPMSLKPPSCPVKFMFTYDREVGILAALDMLYNMPHRSNLISAALESYHELKSNSGFFSRVYDNKIVCFKVYFRYLPGSLSSKKVKGNDVIMDDVSMELDLNSHELCPVYTDDYNRASGQQLTPNAALLVVVTAVDVLTLQPPSSSRGMSSADHRSHLSGLVGICFGKDDPVATWWGITPLFNTISNNSTKGPKSTLKVRKKAAINAIGLDSYLEDPKASATDRGVQLQAKEGLRVVVPDAEAPSLKVDISIPSTSTTRDSSTPTNSWTTESSSASAHLTASTVLQSHHPSVHSPNGDLLKEGTEKGALHFVNTGAHLVPLFHGLPPEPMIRSVVPYKWMIRNLSILAREDAMGSSGLCACGDIAVQQQTNKKGGPVNTRLTAGSSAIVNIVDPRAKRLATAPMKSKPTPPKLIETTMQEILKVLSFRIDKQSGRPVFDPTKFNKLSSAFAYDPTKLSKSRRIVDAIPNSIDGATLVREMTFKCTAMMNDT